LEDATTARSDFANFRKVCSDVYDGSQIRQKCRRQSAVVSHYLKHISSASSGGFRNKVQQIEAAKVMAGTDEIVVNGSQQEIRKRRKPLNRSIFANALFDIDRK